MILKLHVYSFDLACANICIVIYSELDNLGLLYFFIFRCFCDKSIISSQIQKPIKIINKNCSDANPTQEVCKKKVNLGFLYLH